MLQAESVSKLPKIQQMMQGGGAREKSAKMALEYLGFEEPAEASGKFEVRVDVARCCTFIEHKQKMAPFGFALLCPNIWLAGWLSKIREVKDVKKYGTTDAFPA